jgi:hypothetical protein
MSDRARRGRVFGFLALAGLLLPLAALGHAVSGVGFAAIRVHDPVNGGIMPGYVFYPSAEAKGVTWRGPYELDATPNAPPIPKAGHYVFLSPCSPELARDYPEICKDPPGVDRVLLHRQINAAALAFFRKTLDVTSH